MGQSSSHTPVAIIVAVISRYGAALQWAIERATRHWGPLVLQSPTFAFRETDYYEATMGSDLGKTFLAFERLGDPGELAAWKHSTNAWEQEYAALGGHPEKRPLNLDPGYITAAKLVLASTKDHVHRIYLGQQMFAEVTLYFKHGGWRHHEWTFPDYRRADYQQFFLKVRQELRQRTAKPGLP
jgi:hypothetical protein